MYFSPRKPQRQFKCLRIPRGIDHNGGEATRKGSSLAIDSQIGIRTEYLSQLAEMLVTCQRDDVETQPRRSPPRIECADHEHAKTARPQHSHGVTGPGRNRRNRIQCSRKRLNEYSGAIGNPTVEWYCRGQRYQHPGAEPTRQSVNTEYQTVWTMAT